MMLFQIYRYIKCCYLTNRAHICTYRFDDRTSSPADAIHRSVTLVGGRETSVTVLESFFGRIGVACNES